MAGIKAAGRPEDALKIARSDRARMEAQKTVQKILARWTLTVHWRRALDAAENSAEVAGPWTTRNLVVTLMHTSPGSLDVHGS